MNSISKKALILTCAVVLTGAMTHNADARTVSRSATGPKGHTVSYDKTVDRTKGAVSKDATYTKANGKTVSRDVTGTKVDGTVSKDITKTGPNGGTKEVTRTRRALNP